MQVGPSLCRAEVNRLNEAAVAAGLDIAVIELFDRAGLDLDRASLQRARRSRSMFFCRFNDADKNREFLANKQKTKCCGWSAVVENIDSRSHRECPGKAIEWRRRVVRLAPDSLEDKLALTTTGLRLNLPSVVREALDSGSSTVNNSCP